MRGFLDASIVLDLLADNNRAQRFVGLSTGLDRVWCSSPLVRMESRVRVLAERDVLGQARVEEILGSTLALSLSDNVFDRAAGLRASRGLKALDALHVATALEHGCGELWTADSRLAKTIVAGLTIRLVA